METFRSRLDTINRLNWNFPDPGGRELDPSRIANYLSRITDSTDRLVVQKILESTRYVPFPEFKESLFQSWTKFQATGIRSFYLLYPTKIGSESWLIQLLWDQLRPYDLLGIIEPGKLYVPTTEKVDILIIDDMIYSGNNVMSHVDTFTYDLATHCGCEQTKLPYQITIHCVIPYISCRGGNTVLSSVPSFGVTVRFYSMENIPSLSDIILDYDSKFNYFNERWKIEADPSSIYFDHKVANEFGSFPQIYLHGHIPGNGDTGPLVKKVPSRAIIDRLGLIKT